MGGNDEQEQTPTSCQVENGRFDWGVILLAATNRPEVLTRPCCARPVRPPDHH